MQQCCGHAEWDLHAHRRPCRRTDGTVGLPEAEVGPEPEWVHFSQHVATTEQSPCATRRQGRTSRPGTAKEGKDLNTIKNNHSCSNEGTNLLPRNTTKNLGYDLFGVLQFVQKIFTCATSLRCDDETNQSNLHRMTSDHNEAMPLMQVLPHKASARSMRSVT